jgi:hypothetical protein
MTTFAVLVLVFFLALIVESLTEYFFGRVFDKIPALTGYKWALMYVAAVVGVLGAWVYQFDLIALLAAYVGAPIQLLVPTPMGIVLTGLAIGRGSSFIHDLVTQFFTAKPAQPVEFKA